jgi:hypothetical protein
LSAADIAIRLRNEKSQRISGPSTIRASPDPICCAYSAPAVL